MPVLTRDVYWTVNQYMAYYKVSRTHVINLIKRGMPHKRVGNAIRINFTQAEKWLEQFN